MAGQWYGLPKLFPKSENLGYEVVKNDDTLIQFKNKQVSPSQINFGSRLISSDGHFTWSPSRQLSMPSSRSSLIPLPRTRTSL